jgi:serine-type D-Ala-D-Ala carboxypeptidase (penicillin-binding protein 5/6)
MRPALLPALLFLALVARPAAGFDTAATGAFVVDHATGTVLMDKNADVPLPPASMSKLVTLYMLFEALTDGRVTMDTEFRASARAAAMGGSTMFLAEGERVAVRDLIPGIIVNSGNDACVVVAEGLAGTEENFSALATDRMRALGLTETTVRNASGWPESGHVMSLRDLGLLSRRLIDDFPQFYPYFAMERFEFDGRAPANAGNRHPLLGLGLGVDGLKTGHTQEAGYGLAGSAALDGRRIVFVVTGLPTAEARAAESERLVNWALRQFTVETVLDAGTEVARAPVWLGAVPDVALVPAADVTLLVPAAAHGELTATLAYTAPLTAPVAPGTPAGTLTIARPGLAPVEVPLVTAAAVERAGFLPRLRAAARVLIDRVLGPAPAPTG